MRRPALLAGLGLAAALAVAARVAPPETPRPNVVLITLDTTRADHLGAYGWKHARTPNLDGLSRRGARFERCDTAAPITLPSHATILTGLFPPRHGVRDNGTFALPAAVETVTSRLRAAGYDTAAVVSAIVLARRYGLDQGFRLYDDDLGTGYAEATETSERPAEATTRAALAAVSKLRPPFFLWVHYFDPHEEYRPPARLAEKMSGPNRLYDGEIAYVDEQIGALLAGLPVSTDIAVVGDHGEMLGERGELTHGLMLYAAARRVPLILAGPDVPAGRAVPCLVRTADVAPTLLSWARRAFAVGSRRHAARAPPRGAGLWPLELCGELSAVLRLRLVPAARDVRRPVSLPPEPILQRLHVRHGSRGGARRGLSTARGRASLGAPAPGAAGEHGRGIGSRDHDEPARLRRAGSEAPQPGLSRRKRRRPRRPEPARCADDDGRGAADPRRHAADAERPIRGGSASAQGASCARTRATSPRSRSRRDASRKPISARRRFPYSAAPRSRTRARRFRW